MSKSEVNLSQKLPNTTMNKMQSSESNNKSVLIVDLVAAKNIVNSSKILQKPISKGLQCAPKTNTSSTIASANNINKDNTNLQDLDNDDRKKRCADRYDSSESSDSGVATLSCTDSSTASSDTSDPGSPYSLTCDDTNNVNHNNNKMPPHQKTVTKIKTIAATAATPATSALPVTSAAMVSPKTNAIHQKQPQNQPHQWQWTNRPLPQKMTQSPLPPNPNTAITVPIVSGMKPTMDLPAPQPVNVTQQQLLLLQQQQLNANKLKRPTEVLQANVGANKRIKSAAACLPPTAQLEKPKLQTVPPQKVPKPQLIMDESNSQKITGYFKSQIKTNSTLKKDLSNLVAKTTVGKKLPPTNALQKQLAPPALNSVSLENYYNLLTQQTKDVSAKTVDVLKNELDIRTLTAAIMPVVKKTERKTAKISPTVRKVTPTSMTGFGQTASVSAATQLPKKQPVAIAPRLPELKPSNHQNQQQQQQRKKYEADMANLQKLALEQAKHGQPKVLLTAIRIPTQQPIQQKPLPVQQSVTNGGQQLQKNSNPPGLTLTTTTTNQSQNQTSAPPLFQIPVLPNLVQIPNLVAAANAAKNAAANLMVNNSLTAAAAKWNNQLFMQGAAFMKLQQLGQQQNGTMDANQGIHNYVAKQVPFTTSTNNASLDQPSYQLKTQNAYPISTTPPPLAPTQQHYVPTTTQHHQMTPQVFMTSSGLLLNAALPTMLTQAQLANLHNSYQQQQQAAAIPALHPIQPQSAHQQTNTATTSTVLPSINTILHNHHHQHHMNGFYQNGGLYQQSQQILTSQPLITTSKYTTQQQFTTSTANFVPISSAHLFITTSSTPTLTVSAGNTTTVTTNNNGHQHITPSALQLPPLLATTTAVAAAQKMMQPFQTQQTLQKPQQQQPKIPTLTISPGASAPAPIVAPVFLQTTEPPKLVAVAPQSTNTEASVKPMKTVAVPLITALTLAPTPVPLPLTKPTAQPPTNHLTITTKTVKSLTTVSHATIDLCSPTIPSLSPKERVAPCLASPKSLVLERIKSKKPLEMCVDEFGMSTTTYTSFATAIIPQHPPTIDTEFQTASLPESAKSPILSQPITIRFPRTNGNAMRMGSKGSRRSDYNSNNGVCGWDDCEDKFELNTLLMDHLQTRHINTQTGPYVCLWTACKVHSKESVSRSWLERHVLSCHGSEKLLHKCIVEGCILRFGSKTALEKHVNHHFARNDGSKRSSDQFLPKVHRHKKEKRTRKGLQPWAARRFDYIDVGMMEGILFKLISAGAFTTGPKGSIVFKGKPIAKRKTTAGDPEYLVQWSPCDVIANQWLTPTSLNSGKLEKYVQIHELTPNERNALYDRFIQIGRSFLTNNRDNNNEFSQQRKIVLEIIKNHSDPDSSLSSPSSSLSTSSSSSSLSFMETSTINTPLSYRSATSSTPSSSSAKRYRKTPKTPLPS